MNQTLATTMWLLALIGPLVLGANAQATPWTWPDEVSVAEAYNRLYGTDYDAAAEEGLAALAAEHGAEAYDFWNLALLEQVQVLAWDTSATATLYLDVYTAAGVVTLELASSGPWTPPTRGWWPDAGAPVIDLLALYEAEGLPLDAPFQLRVDEVAMGPANTVRANGLEAGELVLGYNEGGLDAFDRDANEPVLLGLLPLAARLAWCPDGANVVVGTEGDDALVGTSGPDCVYGLGGDDYLRGFKGDDRLFGGRGHDELRGGPGLDLLEGGSGDDLLRGGAGDDALLGGPGYDELRGWVGNDGLDGGPGDDLLRGGPGVDTLWGGPGHDLLRGHAGPDNLYGNDGDDELRGGAGVDLLDGGPGDDLLVGGADVDVLFGGPGEDLLGGNAGDDYLAGDAGDDVLHGGLGQDYLYGGPGADQLFGGKQKDTCVAGEWLLGCESTTAAVTPPFAAAGFAYGGQGLRADGTPVPPDRSVPTAALAYTPGTVGYSLGLGGEAAVMFSSAVVNGPGDDLRVWDAGFGDVDFESADVFVRDEATGAWVFLGELERAVIPGQDGAGTFDLGDASFAWTVLVLDTTPPAGQSPAGDGLDLHGVEGLNGLP